MGDLDFAVVVGINRYRGLADLSGAEWDALAFKEWLRKDTGGAVPEGNIAFLHSGANGAGHPRVSEIDDEFEKIHDRFRDAGGGGRRLYIFLAGHGFDTEGDDAALLDATATQRRLGDHISGRLYSLWHKRAGLFEQVALIMDCCRDDYRRVPTRRPPWTDEARLGPDTRMFKGLATRWAYKARERPDPSDRGRIRGLYSRALLGVLNAGRVTGEELKNYTTDSLSALVTTNEWQEPEIQTDTGFVFSEAAGEPRGTLRLRAGVDRVGHRFLLTQPDGILIGDQVMDDQPWIHPDLEFGMYAVTDENSNEDITVGLTSRSVDVII